MEDKYTNKVKGQLLGNKEIKLSFLNKEYVVDKENGETTCTLTCKINLSDMEKNVLNFSDKVKKMVVDGILVSYDLYSNEPKVYYDKRDGKDAQVIVNIPKHEYCYFDTFTVKATAKTDGDDEFNETTGKIIAEAKAKRKAYRRAEVLFKRLSDIFRQLSESFDSYSLDVKGYGLEEKLRYTYYGGVKWSDMNEKELEKHLNQLHSDLDGYIKDYEQ